MVLIHLASLFFLIASPPQLGEPGWQISVELIEATKVPNAAVEELKREVQAIYATASIRVVWLSEGVEVRLPEHACRVYLLERLPARLETRLHAFRGTPPLAVSLGAIGSSSQAIYVSRSAVSEATKAIELSSRALGTALGRVVAHELAHQFASGHHSRNGVLREGFSPGDLTGSPKELRFTQEQATLLRRVAEPIGVRSVRQRSPHQLP